MRRGCVLLAVFLVTSMVPLQVAATTAEEDPTVDRSAAAGWLTGARWDEVGLFTELPNQVVYPHDTYQVLETLEDRDASDRVDTEHPAWSIRRLQTTDGGFLRFQGDTLGPWTSATAYALVFAENTPASVYEDLAVDFLDAHQNEDGGFAPRSSSFSGNLPSFMESTHAAVTGLQAADALNETTRENVVAFLESTQNDDGGWPTSMYNPNQTTMTGTWFAVRTLLSLDALDDATRQAAVDYVLSLEAATGGFAASSGPVKCGTVQCADIGEEITTYSTARAIQLLDTLDALDQAGVSLVEHADWLSARQITNGSFEGAFRSYQGSPLPTRAPDTPEAPGQPSPWEPFEPPVTRFSITTSLALGALESLDALDRADEPAAVDYLVSLQHPGTGGFGWWPGYVGSLPDTGHATRALDALDRLDLAAGDPMADTLSSLQRDGGAITEIDWDHNPRMDHTAHALLSLSRVERTDAVDVDAAATYIADHQTEDGGFRHTESQYTAPSIRATDLAIRTLDAVDELDRINRSAAVDWLADHQGDDGQISTRSADDPSAIKHTSVALRALSLLDSLDAVEVDAASSFLAGWQQDDGTYRNTFLAGLAVNGLATLGDLAAIDTEAVREQIADTQVPRGTTIPAIFYSDDNHAFRQHAVVVEAADALGILSGPTDPCVDHPEPGDVPASLYLDADVDQISVTRGETAQLPIDLAQTGYRYDTVTVSSADTPHGVDVAEIERELAPLELPDPSSTVAANWTATTGTTTLTLCAQDEGGGHAKAQVPLTVEAPPTEQLALDADDRLDVTPGQANATTVDVTNIGSQPADVRLEAHHGPDVTVEPSSTQLRLDAGETASVPTEIAVPATCQAPDTVDLQLRAYGPGGGQATQAVTVNVAERPAGQLAVSAPDTAEASLDTETPIPVTVENTGSAYACLQAEAIEVPDGFDAHMQPAEALVPAGEATELALVVETPDQTDDAKHELAVRVDGQASGASTVEQRLNVTIAEKPAPTLTPNTPEEVTTGTQTTTAIAGEPVRFTVQAEDPDGQLARVEIHPEGIDGPNLTAEPTPEGHLVETTYEQAGSHDVAYVAVDDDGQRSLATRTISVVDNQPPTIELADRTVNATSPLGALVTLDAQTEDPEDRPLAPDQHRWQAPSSFGTATLDGERPSTVLPVGVHEIDLTVGDANGASATEQATVTVDDDVHLDAQLVGSPAHGVTEQATVSVLAQRDDGTPIASPVWINVTHAETGAPLTSTQADIDGRLAHVELPHDVQAGPDGFNLAGEHHVTVETHADSRPAAPIDDLETASDELAYTVRAGPVSPPGPAS